MLGAASRSKTLPRAGIAFLGQEATAPGPSGCSGVLVVLRSTGSTRICCFGVVFCHSSGAERGCSGKERNPEGWHRIKTRPLLTPSPPHAVSQAAPDFLPKCDFSQPEKSLSPSPTAYQSDSHPVTTFGVFFFSVLLHPWCSGDRFRCGRTVGLYIATLPSSSVSSSYQIQPLFSFTPPEHAMGLWGEISALTPGTFLRATLS